MAAQLRAVARELRLANGDTVAAILPGAEAEAALRRALDEGGGRLRLVGVELRANRAKVAVGVPTVELGSTLRWRLERAIEAVNEDARRAIYAPPEDSPERGDGGPA